MSSSRFNLPIPCGWYAVALSAELEAGDVKALRYFAQELVLFRSEAGVASVLNAYCPHLGAHLGHGGVVHGESLACPFHGWQFNGAGECTSVPYASAMPPRLQREKGVAPLPVQELNGVIYAWYHPRGEAPAYEVEAVAETSDADWQFVSTQDWQIAAAIQETNENAVDQAHFAYVHGTGTVPDADVSIEGHRRITRLESTMIAIEDDGTPAADGRTETLRLQSASIGPGLTYQRYSGIFETAMLGLVTPIDADHVHLRFVYHQPRANTAIQSAIAQGFIDENSRQVEQDIPIWEHKQYRQDPILCDGDGPIAQFRKWFAQFYV
jgi:phenylpropionate dioxygenase-like ring-hydroxylating dioxygenase large terminal subunit